MECHKRLPLQSDLLHYYRYSNLADFTRSAVADGLDTRIKKKARRKKGSQGKGEAQNLIEYFLRSLAQHSRRYEARHYWFNRLSTAPRRLHPNFAW